jgi:hypothetical protein
VHSAAATPTNQELQNAIQPIDGPVIIERSEAIHEIGGRVVAWRVWAHRRS